MVQVATGLWYDHSKSLALAPTLTLPLSSGFLLVSGLTLLVTIAGSSFWSLTAYLLHRWMATRSASVVDLQVRVTLRNSATALRTLSEMLKIHHAWSRKPTTGLWARTLSVVIPTLIVVVGFAAAPLLVSTVGKTSTGTVAARMRPENCGFLGFDATTNDGAAAMTAKSTNQTIQARNYMTGFYANSASSSSARSVFVQTTLPHTTDDSAPCPIPAAGRCIPGANRAFSVTSGLLDSHEMLGINAGPEDRVQLQTRVTCSPVNVSDLATVERIGDSVLARLFLGPIVGVSNETKRYSSAIANNTGLGYTMSSAMKIGRDELLAVPSIWQPIPDFDRDDADLSVIFLHQNDLRYIGFVHDPWFSAGDINFTRDSVLFTRANSLVRTMVCADQYRLCNPGGAAPQCSPFGGMVTVLTVFPFNLLGFNDAQKATASRLLHAIMKIGTDPIVSALGTKALWAADKVIGVISQGLPDNQWQVEVLGWYRTGLALLQASIVEWASKPDEMGPYMSLSMDEGTLGDATVSRALRAQCENQLVQAPGEVQNFSLVGVLVIVCLSAVIILVDWSLEWLLDLVGRADSAARRARLEDGKLHLLHRALAGETDGRKGWKVGKWDVPVEEDEDLVPVARVELGKEGVALSKPDEKVQVSTTQRTIA